MSITVNRSQLKRCLSPKFAEDTRSLVRASGLRQLKIWCQLLGFLSSKRELKSIRHQFLQALELVEAQSTDTIMRRMASPTFRGWLSRFGGVKSFELQDPVFRDQIRLWNNMNYSLVDELDFEMEMGVSREICQTWDSKLAIAVPRLETVVIKKVGSQMEVRDPDSGTLLLYVNLDCLTVEDRSKGCSLLSGQLLPNSDIVVRNDLPLLHLKLSDTRQRDTGVVFGEFDHSSQSYPSFESDNFIEAAIMLNEAWSAEYADFQETLQIVIPRGIPHGWRARGMTVSSHQGAVWIMARGLRPIFEHLVHEQSHIKLRYIEESLPILSERQTDERFVVGWRTDPRPIVGIFEGVYVHSHMFLALTATLHKGLRLGEPVAETDRHRRKLRDEVLEGASLLEKHAKFTDAGDEFLSWVHDVV